MGKYVTYIRPKKLSTTLTGRLQQHQQQ